MDRVGLLPSHLSWILISARLDHRIMDSRQNARFTRYANVAGSIIPAYATGVSMLILLFHLALRSWNSHFLRTIRSRINILGSDVETASVGPGPGEPMHHRPEAKPNRAIIAFSLARAVISLSLLCLSLASIILASFSTRSNGLGSEWNLSDWQSRARVMLCISSVSLFGVFMSYSLLISFIKVYLSLLALSLLPSFLHRSTKTILARHLNTLSLIVFVCYVYRDIVPLGALTLTPVDSEEAGWSIWVEITLMGLLGIGIPLVIPRDYVPLYGKVSIQVGQPLYPFIRVFNARFRILHPPPRRSFSLRSTNPMQNKLLPFSPSSPTPSWIHL